MNRIINRRRFLVGVGTLGVGMALGELPRRLVAAQAAEDHLRERQHERRMRDDEQHRSAGAGGHLRGGGAAQRAVRCHRGGARLRAPRGAQARRVASFSSM